MTKSKAGADAPAQEDNIDPPAAPASIEEQPSKGGAFVRQADGTLTPEKQEG